MRPPTPERDDRSESCAVIRKAARRDAVLVAPLILELVDHEITAKQAARRFRRLLVAPSYHCYVAELHGEVIGVWVGREGYLFVTEAPAIQPVALVVSPQHRGCGFGAQLMHACPPGNQFSQSWFTTQHEHLHQYYEGLGWSATGTRFVRHSPAPLDRPSLGRRLVQRIISS